VEARLAVPAVGVMMAALQEDLAIPTRSEFMINLWRLVVGEVGDSVRAEIHEQVRDGIWLIYREAVRGDTETALEILEYVERDPVRLEHFRKAVAPRLAKRTRRPA
jgi:hypothetical protein